MVIFGIGFACCHSHHSIFVRRTKSGLVILTVNVNMLLTGSDSVALADTNEHLKCYFAMKDMRKPKYFLEIEVVDQNMYYFCLKGNMHLISLKKHVFWGANLLTFQ